MLASRKPTFTILLSHTQFLILAYFHSENLIYVISALLLYSIYSLLYYLLLSRCYMFCSIVVCENVCYNLVSVFDLGSYMWMVTTYTAAAMEERMEGLERQMAEYHAEQSRFMETMMKRMEELMVWHPHHHFEGEEGKSRADDPGEGHQRDSQPKGDFNRRVKILSFDGSDASGWLVRMDRYFRILGIPVGEKMDYAVLALHSEALTWFEWWESQSAFHTWLHFKHDLLKHFEPGAASNPLARLWTIVATLN